MQSEKLEPPAIEGAAKRTAKGVGRQAEIHAGAVMILIDSLNERLALGLTDQELGAIALSVISAACAIGRYLRSHDMRIIAASIIALVLAGCAGFSAQQTGARTAIEVATLKYIDGDQQRAQRVHEIASGLIEATDETDGQPIRKTLDAIESKARERIEWSRLDEAEALVVHRVIDAARVEIEHRVQQGTVDESQRVAIRTVLMWIKEIAQLSGGGNAMETVGSNEAVAVGRARTA